jgi:DNA-binding HxlR family transcriptional regulator
MKGRSAIVYSTKICVRYQQAVELLGKRWTGLIVQVLLDGPLGFNQLQDRLEVVSDRMLSERLKELEHAGVVVRTVWQEQPIRVVYKLTEKGRALEQVVRAIASWAESWVTPPRSTRKRG